jgi:hypothetical protein
VTAQQFDALLHDALAPRFACHVAEITPDVMGVYVRSAHDARLMRQVLHSLSKVESLPEWAVFTESVS